MRKIMFNDKYGLTRAVLMEDKTMTRRILPDYRQQDLHSPTPLKIRRATMALPYHVGSEVAIAQSYREINWHGHGALGPGWNNKMFVCADYMPHRIKITHLRIERLQDISEEDVLREGFNKVLVNNGWGNMNSHWEYVLTYDSSGLGRTKQIRSENYKEAFAVLIDKISGVGTWDSNPWVVAYSFKLVR